MATRICRFALVVSRLTGICLAKRLFVLCFAGNELGGSRIELCLDCGEFTLASGELRFCLRALGIERCLGMGTLLRIGNLVDLRLGIRKARFGLGARRR